MKKKSLFSIKIYTTTLWVRTNDGRKKERRTWEWVRELSLIWYLMNQHRTVMHIRESTAGFFFFNTFIFVSLFHFLTFLNLFFFPQNVLEISSFSLHHCIVVANKIWWFFIFCSTLEFFCYWEEASKQAKEKCKYNSKMVGRRRYCRLIHSSGSSVGRYKNSWNIHCFGQMIYYMRKEESNIWISHEEAESYTMMYKNCNIMMMISKQLKMEET